MTDTVYIPENVYSGQKSWGTYVATVSASDNTASVRVQTNVANDRDAAVTATLTTQIVDISGNVVASTQDQKTLAAHSIPGADPTPAFDQTLTVGKPHLWYPNNSTWGKPYMYKVLHTVSIDGQVIDAKESPLGIRVITWDKDFPYINGHKHYLWGAAGRYDYPALGSSVPEEQQWRDLAQLAAAGGNLWRPGHSSSSPEFVAAADAYGVFIVQPSGDGENGFATACSSTAANFQQCQDKETLKKELHRDMIIRDRSHPSILAWEANNGTMHEDYAAALKQVSLQWDPINSRAQSDRTPDVNNGDVISCDGAGCETYVHTHDAASKPVYGAEYWANWGTQRTAYDYELAFALQYLNPWTQARKVNTFGMAQWYFADSPGEIFHFVDGTDSHLVRSMGQSMVDMNRFPRMLYYIYQANWVPYSIKPVVKLAHHWNRSGNVRVNAFSNCPSVRLLVNGRLGGPDQIPNSWDSDSSVDAGLVEKGQVVGNDTVPVPANTQQGQMTTKLPGQVHWDVNWQAGTLTAQCLSEIGDVVAHDDITTAGKADHIVLEKLAELERPDGTSFQLTANGSDAALVVAKVVDANGNLVPIGADVNVTFTVSGPVQYHGGSQQMVTPGQNLHYHAPGDHELQFEGGMTKIALRTLFTADPVTVTATSPGLGEGQVSFNIDPVPNPVTKLGKPSIIAQPVAQNVTAGQPAHFSVTAAGAAPLSFRWFKNNSPVGTNSALLDDPTSQADDGAVYTVEVSNSQGDQMSAQAVLHVFAPAPVTIQQAPQPQNVDAGQSAHFAVVATGSPTLTYQWLKNNQPIPGATNSTYETPVLSTANNGETYAVTVTNPVRPATTTPVTVTVNAARPPTVTKDPASVVTNPGQPTAFSVGVDGSAPFHYQWTKDNVVVGDDSPTLTINAVHPSDVGTYQVTVKNLVGQATSNGATLKLAPPGANLALHKPTFDSSEENPNGTQGPNAVDGDTTVTRWGSNFSAVLDPDNQWLDVDLGSVRKFNRVVLRWENAYGRAYKIQYSNDRQTWQDAYQEDTGTGGVEDISFPSVSGRYVRMQGVKRGTQYGYSLFEFEVYDGAACGAAGTSNERYTVNDTETVTDNLSQVIWTRVPYTLTDQGAQLTQSRAMEYCQGIGARLPSRAEAVAVSSANAATCAFPVQWNTWTSDVDPTDSNFAFVASSAGDVSRQVADNFPGQAMCVVGDQLLPPVITNDPTGQTVGVGRSAHFTVTATGVGPLSYEWFRNGTSVYVSNDAFYDTPAVTASNNGDSYTVQVTSAQGLTVVSAAALLTVDNSASGNLPPGNGGNTGAGNTGGNNTDNTPGDGKGGVNLALHKTSFESGSENDAYLSSSQAFDGNITDTRWSSKFEDPSWIYVDLGAPHTFDHVVLRWERAYSAAYQLQVSDDGKNWKQPFYTENPGLGGTERISFQPQTAQYVRLYSTARSSQYGISLYEFEVYAAVAPTIVTQPAPQSVTVGQTAQFAVSVAAGGPVTYQWRRNGTAIDGATKATYAFVAAQGDSGASFDVVITDINGNRTTSQPAVLTVATDSNAGTGGGNGGTGTGGGNGGTGTGGTTGQQPAGSGGDSGSGATPDYTVYPGFIGTTLVNNTHGVYTDDQIYVEVIAQDPATHVFSWLKPDGTFTHISAADNDATGHLTKNGQNYPNYAFTLAQAKLMKLPEMDSGRIFISIGEPLYIKVLPDANGNVGFAGPNPLNGTDPNIGVRYDWYEFTYNDGGVWINTTQVDDFGLPLLLDVWGDSKNFHQQTGLTETHDALLAEYTNEVPAEFQVPLQNQLRIMAPGKSTFDVGQANEHYFDDYASQIWQQYSNSTLSMDAGGRHFAGQVMNGDLTFNEVDDLGKIVAGGSYIVHKPTTQDILECKGTLATGNSTELALEAQICAAFNRHVVEDSALWAEPSAWYLDAPANYYASFWHTHGVNGLAYGFAYDDVSSQSSTIHTDKPEHIELGIGW